MLMLRNKKERSGDRSFFAVCLNWACAEWRIENGEWKMNAMAECCVCGQWPPLRLNVCKSLETVRRGHTQGHLLWPFGQFTFCRACEESTVCVAVHCQCTTKFHKQNRHIRRETSVCAGFRLQLRKILMSQLQIVRKQRPQPLFAAGAVPRYRRWTDPKPFSALFAG